MHAMTTILLVEDNEDDAELIRYAFDKAAIPNPILTVGDGDAAVNYIEGNGAYADRDSYPLPGLILLDLKLPRRSGFEVLEAVRTNKATTQTPVVVLTSSDQQVDIERAYGLCANAYLVKPVSREALLAMVRALDDFWIKLNRAATA